MHNITFPIPRDEIFRTLYLVHSSCQTVAVSYFLAGFSGD